MWPLSSTYSNVYALYVDHVTRKYGYAVFVFDGYEDGPSTKDSTHLQRTRASISLNVNFSEDVVITAKKEKFLTTQGNKQRFIYLLRNKLRDIVCAIHMAKGDSDVLIA